MLFIIGFVLASAGLILHIIGTATNEWAVSLTGSFGLWKVCVGDICVKYDQRQIPAKYEACQAFALIGVIAAGLGVLLGLLQIIFAVLGKNAHRLFPFLNWSACLTAGVAIFICIVVWGATIQDDVKNVFDVGYSYILCIVADALIPAGGFLMHAGKKS
ncbi:epithelial membrane protein 1 [Biomphalaria pfeifferi]|uniref:Epithelial membrane protein 1 n=1 Tax=Biomphalaria pfeifferi TaxID=112525 RepID=A0AAD8EW35_BIOPF|nr:epithelial membrane protein 1 [Biomphalaria pfeifferi]